MMTRRYFALLSAAILLSGVPASQSVALEDLKLRILGNYGNQPHSNEVERPVFTKRIPEASGGKIKVEFRTVDEVGLKGTEVVRLLKQGAFHIAAMQLGIVSGDIPFVTGMDLPGLAPDMKTARAVVNATREPFDRLMQEKYGGKLLAVWPYPSQVFYCNAKIAGIGDLKGKKVRVFSTALANLAKGLGGIGVTIPFQEVYQGLQRGVADCAISGTTGGNSQKWFEVSTHLYNLSVGWGLVSHAANLDFWNKLSPEARNFLTDQMTRLETEMWDLVERLDGDALRCSTGGTCKFGYKGKMVLVNASPADQEKVKKMVETELLPSWAAACNKTQPGCAKTWNDTAGKILGISVKQ